MKGFKKIIFILVLLCCAAQIQAQQMKLGLLVYGGGGDWYANPTSLKNLAAFCNQQLRTHFDTKEAQVEAGSPDVFNYPFIHMTGHGRWTLTDAEAQNMRRICANTWRQAVYCTSMITTDWTHMCARH